MADIGSYLVGRKSGSWPAATTAATDMLYAAVRKDGQTLEGVEFKHCTFANVSFKSVALKQCSFINCAFLNCYFRRCEMVGTSFIGSKFIGCDFPYATIQSCDFKYSQFVDCSIPFSEMEHSLPREPNLREALSHNLSIASDRLGLGSDGRKYRLSAIQAKEEDLKAAFFSDSEWYQSHYTGLRKLKALVQYVASRIKGIVWGHGEKPHVLVRNLLVLAFIFFPAILWFSQNKLQQSARQLGVWDSIWLSVTTIVPVDGAVSVAVNSWGIKAILAFEAFVGIVGAGLLVAMLVRRMLTR